MNVGSTTINVYATNVSRTTINGYTINNDDDIIKMAI
jgi:hypothetical protein